jgi:hypothetical protein
VSNKHSPSYAARQQAIADELKRYNGHTPCKNCGSYEKYVSCSACVICSGKRMIESILTESPEQRTKRIERNKANAPKNHLACACRKLGITVSDYETMLQRQKGLCAICGNRCKFGRLGIDHNHATGAVRSLLCRSCNLGLGYFKENVIRLEQAIQYLKDTECL